MIDLLDRDNCYAQGATPEKAGIRVDIPWGSYSYSDVSLATGWYHLEARGAHPKLWLGLYEHKTYRNIEMEADSGQSTLVRLTGGLYNLTLLPGATPGFYPLDKAELAMVPRFKIWVALIKRLLQAARGRLTIKRLGVLFRRARSKTSSFGMRPSTDLAAGLGVVARQSRPEGQSLGRVETPFTPSHVDGGPRFLIHLSRSAHFHDLGLEAQVGSEFTFDPGEPYDAVLSIGEGQRLLPGALATFAESMCRQPGIRRFIADSWVGEWLSAHVAWDPILYENELPTPFVWVGRVSEIDRAYRAERQMCATISLPLATSPARALVPAREKVLPHGPACSVIIPTRDRADLLGACLAGLFSNTAWPHEVIVVDNGSVEPATFECFETYKAQGLRIIRADMPFNFSTLCNKGVQAARHDYLVFLNNDLVLNRPDWLAQMMRFAVRPEIGAVGARLLYEDGRLQHGGIMLGLTQISGHLWRHLPLEDQECEPRLVKTSLRSAVTGAALCVARGKFDLVGGFDERHFPVTLNDVDFCLKLLDKGYLNLLAADAVAYHLEGQSRGEEDTPEKASRRQKEMDAFHDKWKGKLYIDPWLPISISRATEVLNFK